MNLPLLAALLYSWLVAGFVGYRAACGRQSWPWRPALVLLPDRLERIAASLEGLREDARLERIKVAPDDVRMYVAEREAFAARVRALVALCGLEEGTSPSRDLKRVAEAVRRLRAGQAGPRFDVSGDAS